MPIRTEIITIGDELLIGQTIDTNSAWLGQQLDAYGFSVVQISSIPDMPSRITQTLDDALQRADIVIITGGLGPTIDDLTKTTLATYFGMRLVPNKEVLENIERIFGSRNIPLGQLNINQANIPEGCLVLENNSGTAPGMLFRKGEKVIVSLPGVPYEMKSIVSGQLLPWLQKNIKTEKRFYRMVMTTGYPESALAAKLKAWEESLPPHCSVAYLPSPGIVKLRVSASDRALKTLQEDVDSLVNKLIAIIPEAVYSLENETLEALVGRLLVKVEKTMGTAESCTGGSIASLITSIPGSSRYYSGSIVTYSNELKIRMLGIREEDIIKYGAVSEEVVSQMAQNARKELDVDYAIATSGVAGPEGGTEEKPVGLIWISVASEKSVVSQSFRFGNHRGRNITRSSIAALNMLRLLIQAEFQIL